MLITNSITVIGTGGKPNLNLSGRHQSQSLPTTFPISTQPPWKWSADSAQEQFFPDFIGTSLIGENPTKHPISKFPSTSFPQDAPLPGNRISSPPSWKSSADSTQEQVSPNFVGAYQKSLIHRSTSVPATPQYAQQPGNRRLMSMPAYLPESGNEVIGMLLSLQTRDLSSYVIMNKHDRVPLF